VAGAHADGDAPGRGGDADVDDARALGLGELAGLAQDSQDGGARHTRADDELDESAEAGLV
jgi:hypothetical protein